jgi:hypothetical protein
VPDSEGPPWYFLLWLRVTMPLTKRLRRPTRGTQQLNEAVAARLAPHLTAGFTVEPDPTGLLGFHGPRAGGVITATTALHLPLPRRWRLHLAVRQLLHFYQDLTVLGTEEPPSWPAPGAHPRVRVTGTEVHLGYADRDGKPVLAVDPIPRSELGL